MARHAADRDDLFAELASASPRWELQVPGWTTPIVTGLRPGGVWSLYFHGDCCYHFDGHGALRRAFVNNAIYRSEGATLARLIRQRTEHETSLLRNDLNSSELAEFIGHMRQQLSLFETALRIGNYQVVRQIPEAALIELLIAQCQQAMCREPPLSAALKS